MSKKPKKPYTGRDHLMVKVINGVTKAGIHNDHKKEANKMASRKKVELEEDRCIQCGFPYTRDHIKDKNELAAMDCGYCSVSCMDYDEPGKE